MPTDPPHLLVTGAAGGIGSAVARLAAERGWHVTTWDVAPGADHRLDLADPAAVSATLDETLAAAGPLTALIHCAGRFAASHPLTPEPTAWRELLDANLLATVNVCSAVGRHLAQRRRGAIVAITSNAAHTPRVAMDAYAASKAAAASYLRSLGLALAADGVRCNAVSPGSTLTPMLTASAEEVIAGAPGEYRLGIPLGRPADPADIAEACLWLASDQARHVTLHDLRVDGGATLDAE